MERMVNLPFVDFTPHMKLTPIFKQVLRRPLNRNIHLGETDRTGIANLLETSWGPPVDILF